MKQLLIICLFVLTIASCDFLEPAPIQDQTTEDLWSHETYGQGILTNAYSRLDISYPITMDFYTDNAVPSQPGINNLALGSWTVENSPIGDWENSYNAIRYLNIYIDHGEELIYAVSDPVKDSILKSNRMGEAYFLRAWYEYLLLQNFAGYPEVGTEALGFPIVDRVLNVEDDLDLPRNTYTQCLEQIVSDCDKAIAVLPLKYAGADQFDGTLNTGRASGLGAMALKARVYLNAASPAFGNSNQELWAAAAASAYEAIDMAGGLLPLTDYANFNTTASQDNFWVSISYTGRAEEMSYYPPSLYGAGLCNPSQNLADAFPAADGYPISLSSTYDPANPYDNRDPRFYRFLFYNGDDYNSTIIETFEGGADAPGGLNQQGTRTGYYMKKLLSKKVKLTPGSQNTDVKFKVLLGKTELYLNFAEAANEAYGPNDATLGISAADVMRVIRERAGIDSNPLNVSIEIDGTDTTYIPVYDDQYLDDQAAAGKDAFRAFIQENRRVELSFEGFRFWDIRRLNLPLNHTIKGVKITENSGSYSYEYVNVENHTYQEYMRYAPLPYSQTLIMNNLEQNKGW